MHRSEDRRRAGGSSGLRKEFSCETALHCSLVVLLLALAGVGRAQSYPSQARGLGAAVAYQGGQVGQVNLFNGGLTAPLPVGQRYSVDPSLSYGITLVYTSNVWDHELQTCTTAAGTERYYLTEIDPEANAGAGWRIQLGGLIPPGGPGGRWRHLGFDGSERGFYPELHPGHGNQNEVFYSNASTWRLEGSHGRTQTIRFEGASGEYERVTSVELTKFGGGAQLLSWQRVQYDGLGFLLGEKHPELGPSGNGWTTYARDALGNPTLRSIAGDSSFNLGFKYDAAGRLIKVEELAVPRLLKEFSYARSNFGNSQRKGKLFQAKRHNWVDPVTPLENVTGCARRAMMPGSSSTTPTTSGSSPIAAFRACARTRADRLRVLNREPTVDDVLRIRDDLAKEFGLERFRP